MGSNLKSRTTDGPATFDQSNAGLAACAPIYSFSFHIIHTRRFEVHPKSGVKRLLSLPMPNNSLLIMGDEMQLHYTACQSSVPHAQIFDVLTSRCVRCGDNRLKL
eukprot:g43724.t1